jgi:hypothetical protein
MKEEGKGATGAGIWDCAEARELRRDQRHWSKSEDGSKSESETRKRNRRTRWGGARGTRSLENH